MAALDNAAMLKWMQKLGGNEAGSGMFGLGTQNQWMQGLQGASLLSTLPQMLQSYNNNQVLLDMNKKARTKQGYDFRVQQEKDDMMDKWRKNGYGQNDPIAPTPV